MIDKSSSTNVQCEIEDTTTTTTTTTTATSTATATANATAATVTTNNKFFTHLFHTNMIKSAWCYNMRFSTLPGLGFTRTRD